MNKKELRKVCKKLSVIAMVAMLLVTSIPSAFAADGRATSRAGNVEITDESQLESLFPDAKFRAAVFAAVKNGADGATGTDVKDALKNFTGVIDAKWKGIDSNTKITDITGLDLLRQAEEIDLRKNMISDFSQLGKNKGTEEEFKTWFGVTDGTDRTEGENVHIRIGGNPIEKIPTDFGGKIVIEQPGSTAYTYDESPSSHFTYLRPEDGSGLSGTINIGKSNVVDHGSQRPAKVISANWNSHGKPTASKFKVDSFTNTTATFSQLKKSGTGYIAVGVDEEIHYQTADEYGTITPGSQSFKYYLSPTFTIYDKLTVKSVNEGNVVLKKTDSDTSDPVAGAVYNLYKGDDTLLKSGLITNQAGKITVIGLAAGNYYFEETKAPAGYGLNSNPVNFEITVGASEASKKVTLGGGMESITPTGGTAITAKDGECYFAPDSPDITLSSTDAPDSVHVTYSSLEVDGIEKKHVSRVFSTLGDAQTDINKEKNANHILGAVNVEADFTDASATPVSANTTDKKIATIEIHGTKTWIDHVDYHGPVPDIELTLLANGTNAEDADGNTITTKLQGMLAHHKYVYSFTGLPETNAGGPITYTIKETLLSDINNPKINPNGYKRTSPEGDLDIVNEYDDDEKTSVKVKKTWIDNSNADGKRPNSIKLTLYAKGSPDAEWEIVNNASNAPLEPSQPTKKDNVWEYTFTDLPKYSGQELIEYNVVEDSIADYVSTVTPNKDDPYAFDITNVLARASISGEKKWVGDSEGNRPAALTIQLYREEGGKDVLVKEAIINKANNWKYEFQGIAKYDTDGNEYVYFVKEKNVPTNYTPSYEGFDVTNTYTPPTSGGNAETTFLAGTKIWKDYNNALKTRPDTLTVSLYQNGTLLSSEIIREIIGWHYRFDNLPKYDALGKEYVYTIKENQVPEGYIGQVSKDNATISNTLNEDANQLVSLNIQKKWVGDDKSKDRPKSILVNVYRNGDTTPIKKLTLSATNKWMTSIKGLPKFDDNGTPFKYTISEEKVKGYKSVQTKTQVATTDIYNFVITNTKLKPGEPDSPSDKPNDPTDPDNPSENSPDDPKTGDQTPLGLFVALIVLASGGITALVHKRKQE